MELDEAKRLLRETDASDTTKTLDAIATVLRFYGITDPRLIDVAEKVEQAKVGMR